MTESQALHSLKSAGIAGVRKENRSAPLKLLIRSHGFSSEVTLVQFKSDLLRQIHLLEEQRRSVEENAFAGRMKVNLKLGSVQGGTMEVLKSNEQLTSGERQEKKRLLKDIEVEMRRHEDIVTALKYLQVHLPEMAGKLEHLAAPEGIFLHSGRKDAKGVWSRGIHAAALQCLAEAKRRNAGDAQLLGICAEFLDRFMIEDDPRYTAEQLLNNIRQIRHLENS